MAEAPHFASTRQPHAGHPPEGTAMHDLISFLGILAAAVMLICIGHVAPTSIAVIATGLGTLFAGWGNRGHHDHHDHSPRKTSNHQR